MPLNTLISLLARDPQPTLLTDASLRIIDCNPALSDLQAGTRAGSIHPLLPVNVQSLLNSVLSQDRAIENVEARFADRIYLWPLIPAGSDQILIRGRDATEELQLRDQAIRSSRLYRLITENTTDLISRHAPDGRFIDATPASWQLLGYRPEELRDQPLESVLEGDQAADQLARTREQLRETGYATMTVEIRHRDGSRRWFEIASRAIRETYTGAVIEVVSVSRDITERVRSEEKNRLLADELAHTARLATLGELASSIAHEMNQPLASIMNFANASLRFMKDGREDPKRLERVDDGLQKIIYHANRASDVIQRLRAFLRKGRTETGPTEINDVVADAVRLCQWEADKNRVRLKETLTAPSPVINADPVLLEQVMINLVRNAMEANAEKHHGADEQQASQVEISTQLNTGGEILICVNDEGPGLSEDGIRQMFQPFHTSKPKGLGLGLSMSRSIVEGFGGFLDAHPAESGGLSLICRFPPNQTRTQPTSGAKP